MMPTQTNAATTTLRLSSLLTFAALVPELLNQSQSLKSQLLKSQSQKLLLLLLHHHLPISSLKLRLMMTRAAAIANVKDQTRQALHVAKTTNIFLRIKPIAQLANQAQEKSSTSKESVKFAQITPSVMDQLEASSPIAHLLLATQPLNSSSLTELARLAVQRLSLTTIKLLVLVLIAKIVRSKMVKEDASLAKTTITLMIPAMFAYKILATT
jgi:hypothetical protein